jgi:hypothetical protein
MPKFTLGLEEVAAQPVDRRLTERTGPDRIGTGAGDDGARLEHQAMVAQNLGIADPGVDHRHMLTLVPEDAHDRVELGSTLCELGAYRVAKPVRGDGGTAIGIN